jgi:hypothetical protein
MWPFTERSLRLEDLVGPTKVDVVTRVVSPNLTASPTSGLRAAFVLLEAFERVPRRPHDDRNPGDDAEDFLPLGAVIVGDLVTLEVEGTGASVDVCARRATMRLVKERAGVMPIVRAIPELVPLLSHAKRSGVLCQREHLVLSGDRLRLQAVVERTSRVVAAGYRSGTTEVLVVRDDLAPVILDEVFEAPGF